MSVEEYDAQRVYQNYRCALCGVHESQLLRKLAVDHDHETGRKRGLLCGNCNSGLGKFKDDAELLKKAAAYLETAMWASADHTLIVVALKG